MEVVDVLVKHPDLPTEAASDALIAAIKTGHVPIAWTLLDNGADPNYKKTLLSSRPRTGSQSASHASCSNTTSTPMLGARRARISPRRSRTSTWGRKTARKERRWAPREWVSGEECLGRRQSDVVDGGQDHGWERVGGAEAGEEGEETQCEEGHGWGFCG
ncbi:hypothetical protein M427DRAFT_61535 [Gonapodya prolifera JEL478]|uniref:Ankyrin n=1 Tax=Gonapodya prolifera (strain JEL478) TaxID=1344416 RepID=A0A139A200_GONPJ|nr:hypothetical protein M427DRAFT_61535 [Gonapodya prolifera JEL478]|eukprot:KXS10820.1 hypothetical protein M427DRAFT_61535 [Gonapodya prolifera JEL478]